MTCSLQNCSLQVGPSSKNSDLQIIHPPKKTWICALVSWDMSTTNHGVSTSLWQTEFNKLTIFHLLPNGPADLASRGAHAEERISSSKWWKGPEFLWSPIEEDCRVIKNVSELPLGDPEVKRVCSFGSQTEKFDDLEERLCYFSNLSRAKRAVALCIHYIDILETLLSILNIVIDSRLLMSQSV